MTKAAYPTIGIAAFVMFVIVYFIGWLQNKAIEQLKALFLILSKSNSLIKKTVLAKLIIFFFADTV